MHHQLLLQNSLVEFDDSHADSRATVHVAMPSIVSSNHRPCFEYPIEVLAIVRFVILHYIPGLYCDDRMHTSWYTS